MCWCVCGLGKKDPMRDDRKGRSKGNRFGKWVRRDRWDCKRPSSFAEYGGWCLPDRLIDWNYGNYVRSVWLGSGLHKSILAHPTITSFPIGSDQYGHFPLVPVAVSLRSRCSKLRGDWLLMVLLDVHFLQIVFTPLDFFNILLFYSLCHCPTHNTPYRKGLMGMLVKE